MNRTKIRACVLATIMLVLACGCSNNSQKTAEDIGEAGASVSLETASASESSEVTESDAGDSETMTSSASDYEYPDEFKLTGPVKGAIEQLAIWYPGDSFVAEEAVRADDWQEFVISTYAQNNWDGYDYIQEIENEHDGIITKEQLEFIQYSLTGIEVKFDSMKDDDTVNCFDIKNGSYYGNITDYTSESKEDEVTIHAKFETSASNGGNKRTYDMDVVLKQNPKSCFDGYSIKSITKEDTTVAAEGDASEHSFWAWDMDSEGKDGSLAFEMGKAEEDIEYNGIVYVKVTDNQKKYVKENSGSEFKITYVYEDDMQEPIERVTAVSIEKVK